MGEGDLWGDLQAVGREAGSLRRPTVRSPLEAIDEDVFVKVRARNEEFLSMANPATRLGATPRGALPAGNTPPRRKGQRRAAEANGSFENR
jgi:hypothetical protein